MPDIPTTTAWSPTEETIEHIFVAGAGTGVNAAYMATIVGPDGHVVADPGVTNVDVVLGDDAPFDRVISTVSTSEMPTA